MALMFFPDPDHSLREMASRHGPVPVRSRCSSRPAWTRNPPYEPFVEVAARHAGREARSLLTTYFACGDLDELTGWFGQAGLRVIATVTHAGSARFPSTDAS